MISIMNDQINTNIILFETEEGNIAIPVTFDKETLWLSLKQISELFERDKSVISRHLSKIFDEEELDKNSVVAFFATTASDDKIYNVEYFNLDAIISVGYRVNSRRGTQFRKWSNKILKDYIQTGYAINNTTISYQMVANLGNTIFNYKFIEKLKS
jgi:DNA ligase (NAD+)